MRLIATADLHYDLEPYRPRVEALAARMVAEEADVLAIAGDIFAGDLQWLEACLRLFADFPGEKVLVAGNHDLWTLEGDSFELYDRTIPRVAGQCGFHDLDAGPRLVGDVALVGTIGWYDYSFRDTALGIPMRFYEHKVAPGYARRFSEYAHLLDPDEDLPPSALAARSTWNDGRMIRWDLDDHRFTQLTVDRLEGHMAQVEGRARAVVAITHHLPFAPMLRRKSDPSWGFGNAFMGSEALGQALLRHPKVTHLVCGHSHTRDRQRVGHIEAINVGCTYRMKRYEVVSV
ncbi:MAG: metallophosphoesterase [Candidatus Brocadiia bacterium]